jgi:hypothetical protein
MLRDLVIALSLSNLWFFNIWRFFLITHSYAYPYYHWKANPAPILLGTMLDIVLLSAIFWLTITIARHSDKTFLLKIARPVFIILFYVALIDIALRFMISGLLRLFIGTLIQRPQLLFRPPFAQCIYLWLGTLGLIIGFTSSVILFHRLVFRREKLVKLVTALLLIGSPFVLFTFGSATSQWMKFKSGNGFQEVNAPPLTQRSGSGRRVVWIIFDEMDFRLSFLDRPSSVRLPAFDRLRNEAIFAENAYPPGGDTVLSLPALITGRLISKSHRTAANELMLTFADNNQTAPWSTQPNVFSRAKEMGFNSALAGWYHPYCRIIGKSLSRCSWETMSAAFLPDEAIASLVSRSRKVGVGTSMLGIGETALMPELVRVFMESRQGRVSRSHDFENYTNIHREAMRWVGDADLQLILLHYPIPHPPGIYDRSTHDFSFDSSSDYLGNLALADRTLAELRQQMERAGLWESTTVLVTSDHRLRADRVWRHSVIWQPTFTKVDPLVFNSVRDERVPFILKMAGGKTALRYEPTFNTVLSHDLILAVLSGELAKESDVVSWLNQNRSIGESPYIEGEN